MSGHSKWHNIQARKGKQDAKRGSQFTKLAKAITIAAQKGADPSTNFSLRLAIEKSRQIGMPKDNIERAIKRGTGEADGKKMEEILYEAYGPNGIALLLKVVTDNKNRTVSEIKHIFSKHGGSLGSAGSVQWMFSQWGMVSIQKEELAKSSIDHEDFEMKLIDAGVEDIKDGEAGEVDIRTKIENFQKVLGTLKEGGLAIKESSIQWIPQSTLPTTKEIEEKLTALFSELEEHDDVEDYFTNAA